MKTLSQTLAAAFALGIALSPIPASAVTYTGHVFATPAAGNSVVAYGSGDAQSFDINFGRFTQVTLTFINDDPFREPYMGFNALIGNFIGHNLTALSVRLTGGAEFDLPHGTVTGSFGIAGPTMVTPTLASTPMLVAEPYQVSFGNPLSLAGQSDWRINYSGVSAGSTFGVTVTAVPEPGAYLMLLAGLAAVGTMVRAKGRGRREVQ